MSIHRLRYFHGLFPDETDVGPAGARLAVDWRDSEIPRSVLDAFESENVVELGGVHGDPHAGDPLEVDDLHLEHDCGPSLEIRVLNRAIAFFTEGAPEVVRLHRFFSKIWDEAEARE